MIKTFRVEKLAGKFDPPPLTFNEDVNIITGRNGSGKTLLMKMLWYCLSGNIELLCREIPFESLNLKTENYELIIEPQNESKRIRVHYSSEPRENHSWTLAASSSSKSLPDPHEIAFQKETRLYSTAYFPTFRRFDGGYGCDSAVQKVIRDWSHSLCKWNHNFITSIDLIDIGDLLNREYSLRTKRLNERIDEIIHNSNSSNQNSLNTISEEKSVLLKPFDVLPKLASQILGYPGIRIENSIPIGDEKNAINANYLSLGEKQMLSFLCYNIFLSNASIFIDEPENSLHPDWQRQLISTLLEQSTNNQLIIATHSPFIYAMYSDKELNLNEDRGGEIMPTEMRVNEIVGYLKHSVLTTVLVEGITDEKLLRKLRDVVGKQVYFLTCGGRVKLLEIFRRRSEFPHLSVAFIADKDLWVFSQVPCEYETIVFTWGYSIENDLVMGVDLKSELLEREEEFYSGLKQEINDWAEKVRKLLLKGIPPIDRSIPSLVDEINAQPIQKTQGKILLGILNKFLNSRGTNPGKFWDARLNESHQPWMRLIRDTKFRLGLE